VKFCCQNLCKGFQLSGAPEPPCVTHIISFLSIAGALQTRIVKEFRMFTESIMLNNLQSIAEENRYQHLDSCETDQAQYIFIHPATQILSKGYRVDLSCYQTQIAYSRLTPRIPSNISTLSNEIQAHLKSTLLWSVMDSDLTPHAYSIQRQFSRSRYSLFT